MKRNNYQFQRIVLRLVILLWFFFFLAQGLLAQSQWSDDDKVNNPIAALAGSNQFAPAIAKDGFGGAIITWVDSRTGNFDIFFQRVEPSGKLSWTGNGLLVDVDPDMASQELPSIVAGLQGDFFIAWQDNRNKSSEKEIFAQKFNIDGQPQWNPTTRAHLGNNSAPLILRNSSFGVITASYVSVLFDDFITFQFINNNGIPQLAQQGLVSSNAKGIQPNRPPAVISGLDGGIIATWVDTRNVLPAVYANGIKRTGTSTSPWPAGEILVSSTVTNQTYPVAISDSQGGAIIAWINPANGSQDNIKVQRFDVNGNPQWTAGGVVINSIPGKKNNINITSDGQKGAYIIWENLSGTNWNLIAQRVSSNGTPWSNDFRLCLANGNQTNATIIFDSRGEAIVAWEDDRHGNLDIFAQKIDSTGVVRRWKDEGQAVTTAPNAQKNPVLVDDKFAGAIIAWEDQRNITSNGTDIYAQKVSDPGVLGEIRTITIKSPNGGENWERGSKQIISWEWTGEIGDVLIQVSKNGGTNWQDILSPTPIESNSIEWNIDLESSNQWLLRLTDIDFNFINDVSDQTFTVSEPQGPTIQHSQINQTPYGDSLRISALITDISGIDSVYLNYRKGGAQHFQSVQMLPDTGDVFTHVIPPDSVTERGLEYYINSIDSIDHESSTDTFFVSVAFGAGVQTLELNGGTKQSAYRMISSPNNLDEIFADSIFAFSGFGAFDTTSWRVFLYQDTGYVELDSTTLQDTRFTFKPGKAFWLITDRDRTIVYGSGTSSRSDTIFTIMLKPGWNQIGLPFAFPVAWNDILAATSDSLKVDGPFLYSGTYTMPEVLAPYEGYFVYNLDSLNAIKLIIPPKASEISNEPLSKPNISNSDWALQINAICQEARDEFNFFGIHQEASEYWDPLDHAEPPPIGEFISLYFPHNEWDVYPSDYTTDFRTMIGEGQTWRFTVSTNIRHSEAKVVFTGLETLPQDFEIILLDEKLNISQDLRKNPVYTFPSGAFGTNKNLKVLVGKREFLAQETSNNTLIPDDFELSQNFPNPFNPVTFIRFGLPSGENVRITIFDILGREVTKLVDNEHKEAGYHVITWNGKDRFAREVASGVYVYRLEAGKFYQTRKMLLLK